MKLTMAFFLSKRPLTDIKSAIHPNILSMPVRHTFFKITIVNIAIDVSISASPIDIIELEWSFIWVSIIKFHCSMTLFDSIFPLTLICITIVVSHQSKSFWLVINKISVEIAPIRINELPFTVFLVVLPVSLIFLSVRKKEYPISWPCVFFPFPIILLSSWKIKISSCPITSIVSEISFVNISIYHILLPISFLFPWSYWTVVSLSICKNIYTAPMAWILLPIT